MPLNEEQQELMGIMTAALDAALEDIFGDDVSFTLNVVISDSECAAFGNIHPDALTELYRANYEATMNNDVEFQRYSSKRKH